MKKLTVAIKILLFLVLAQTAHAGTLAIEVLDQQGQRMSEFPNDIASFNSRNLDICCAQPQKYAFKDGFLRSIEFSASRSVDMAIVNGAETDVCNKEQFDSYLKGALAENGISYEGKVYQVRRVDISDNALRCLIK